MRAVRIAAAAAVVAALTPVLSGGMDGAAAEGPGVRVYGDFTADSVLGDLVSGPGDRMWFSVSDADDSLGVPPRLVNPRLASVTPDGVVTEHPMPYTPQTIVPGGDGTLWISSGFSGGGRDEPPSWPVIARVSAAGTILEEHELPAVEQGYGWMAPWSMTMGPDGDLWYVSDHVGHMTSSGTFTRFEILGSYWSSHMEMTTGAAGDLWWVDPGAARIGRITTAGAVTFYPASESTGLRSIIEGPDGTMWSLDTVAQTIVKVSAAGQVSTVPFADGWISPHQLIRAPDGAMWAVGSRGMVRLDAAGASTEYRTGARHDVTGATFGADGRLWYVQNARDDTVRAGVAVLSDGPTPTGEFTALTPARILDTRSGLGRGGATGPLGGADQIDVQATGRGGVPATGVSAVVLNATVTGPTAASYLSVWPAGHARPWVSNLNYVAGQTVPNLVTVAVGSGGKLSVFNGAGSTNVVFDVLGFYSDSTGPFGARFVPVEPRRVLDTRDGTGGVSAQPVGSGGSLPFDVARAGTLPDAGVSAVVMNVTVTRPTAAGYLTVHPDGVTAPLASNLNFVPGQSVANLVTVRVSTDGSVRFFNATGTTHVIADIVGYYSDEVTSNAGRFVPLTPARVRDTREDPWPIGPGEDWTLPVDVLGVGGAPPADVGAVVLNVTATDPTAPGYVIVGAEDCQMPGVSSVNFGGGQTVPNQVITPVGVKDYVCSYTDGRIGVYNAAGFVDVIVDLFGYFTDDAFTHHRAT